VTVTSFEDTEGSRCIDIVEREDHTFVLKEYRRDLGAWGQWSVVADYSGLIFMTKAGAVDAAKGAFPWLAVISK
jgi:hypothetical protein